VTERLLRSDGFPITFEEFKRLVAESRSSARWHGGWPREWPHNGPRPWPPKSPITGPLLMSDGAGNVLALYGGDERSLSGC